MQPNKLSKRDTYIKPSLRRALGIGAVGAVAITAFILGSKSFDTSPEENRPVVTSTAQQNIPLAEPVALPLPTSQQAEVEQNVQPRTVDDLQSADIFGTTQPIEVFYPKIVNDIVDLTPPPNNAIYQAASEPPDNSFNDTLQINPDGTVNGRVLLGGHTHSNQNWEMNKISNITVGYTFKLNYDGADLTATVDKITDIDETGGPNGNEWPGFAEAIGQNGALFGCKRAVDQNGAFVQTGYVTVVGFSLKPS